MLIESDPNLCLRCHAQVQTAGRRDFFIGNVDHTPFLQDGDLLDGRVSHGHPRFKRGPAVEILNEHSTFNVEHPTSNASRFGNSLDVECWVLGVRGFPSISNFASCLLSFYFFNFRRRNQLRRFASPRRGKNCFRPRHPAHSRNFLPALSQRRKAEKSLSGSMIARRHWPAGITTPMTLSPGDSANSWLIHYVARQVKDMEMPPVGKGNPLTPEQISLLRAWIDQGANWNTTNQTASTWPLLSRPRSAGLGSRVTRRNFANSQGVNDGFSGGVDEFSFTQQTSPTEKFLLSGHVIVPDQDYQVEPGGG